MGYIGAALQTVTPDNGVQLQYQGKGVAVQQVIQGGPADAAGLQPGDVIQKVNGKDVTTNDDVVSTIKGTKPGSTINFQIWSAGVKKLVSVKVTERPADAAVAPQQEQQDPQQP
jgi:serine protease Do